MVLNWDVVIDPPRSLKQDESIFGDKAYVAEWVSRLPLAASGKAAENICIALENVTAHQLPYVARLYFLEQTSSVITSLMQGLLQGVHQEGLPLQEKTAERAKLLLDILALKVIGYRQVIDSLTASLFAGGFRRRQLMGSCMMRVMELIGQMLEIYRYASIPPAPGLWYLFNRYYAIAEADKQLDSRFSRIQGNGKATVSTLFKTQMLLDGLNYYDLRYSELEQARSLIGSMVDHVTITSSGDVTQPHHFCFRVDEDAPPSRFAPERKRQCESTPQRRVVNMGPLMGALKKLLDQSAGVVAAPEAANQVVALKLYEGWHITGGGRDERQDMQRRIRLAFGLSNIVASLAKEHHDSDPFEDQEESHAEVVMGQKEPGGLDADIEGIDKELHSHMLEEERDEWSIVPYTAAERDSWSDDYRKELVSQIFDACLVNESAGGFGVSMARDTASSRFKAGELVALEIDRAWVLASVRWVRMGEERVAMGLARIGAKLQPFSLVVHRGGKESQPLPVLLLKHRNGEAAIVLHNLNLSSEKQVSFAGSQTLSAGQKLDSTPSFICYQIEEEVYERLLRASVLFREQGTQSEQGIDQETLEKEWQKLTAERQQMPVEEPSGYDMVQTEGFDKLIAHNRNNSGDQNE